MIKWMLYVTNKNNRDIHMKDKADKYFDDIAKKIIQQGSIESPSFNFTDTVMSQVLELNKSRVTMYKPLISKKGWFIILAVLITVIVYTAYFGEPLDSASWISQIDFGVFSSNGITNLLSFKVSKAFTYAVVFLAIMIGVQVVFLKNYFNQRFQH